MARCIVLADAHAQPHLIQNVLSHSHYDKHNDRLIFAGDFIDIGCNPIECWKLLSQSGAEMLWGNHEAAIVLKQFIGPQDPYSWSLYDELEERQNEFKIVAIHDQVLITHAGLSETFVPSDTPIEEIVKTLNGMDLIEHWHDDSPLWYRPNHAAPYDKLLQVCGHTPPLFKYSSHDLSNLYMVDPYNPLDVSKSRFRYAMIENNKVYIVDSLYV